MPSAPDASGRAAAIIVAAGRGTRFGASDKVLADLGGRPVLAYSLEAAENSAAIDAVVVVAGTHTRGQIEQLVATLAWPKVLRVVIGGERRQDSVEAGFSVVPPGIEVVVVHDGARPFVSPTLFDSCAAEALRAGAAIAATPVTDTLKRSRGRTILETVDRTDLWAAQTPQAFRTHLLRDAFAFARTNQLTATDEAGILESMGIAVTIVESTARNMKMTTTEDLDFARALLAGIAPDKNP